MSTIWHYPNPDYYPQRWREKIPSYPGIPVIPPIPEPNNPYNPYAAQCGECGRLIPHVDLYSCPNERCPVQPKVWC